MPPESWCGYWLTRRSGSGHAHQPQHLDRASARVFAREAAVQDQRFGDLMADGQHRIQRRHRLLEDHGNGVAANLAHLRLRQLEQVAALEDHPSADRSPRRRRDQAQNRQRRDALAAAGLADDGERLAAPTENDTPSTARTTPSRVKKYVFRPCTSSSGAAVRESRSSHHAPRETRVERVAHAVAEQIHREHRERQTRCRERQ